MVEKIPQNGFCQYLYPLGEFQSSPTCPGGSLRSTGRFDPDFFQITASGLSPKACDIFCVPFKRRSSISHSTLALPKQALLVSKVKHSGSLSSHYRTPQTYSHSQLCQEKALSTTGLKPAQGTAGLYSHIPWDMDVLTSEQALPQDNLGPCHDHQQANPAPRYLGSFRQPR